MSEDKNNEYKNDNEKGDLSQYYDFTYSDKERERSNKLPYFEKVEHDLSCVQMVQDKLQQIREELKIKQEILKNELAQARDKKANEEANKEAERAKGNEAPDKTIDRDSELLEADLNFCERADVEGAYLQNLSAGHESTLKEILEKNEEKSYSVIVDIALKPLPSQRAKDKDNTNDNDNNDKDKNKDKNKNKDNDGLTNDKASDGKKDKTSDGKKDKGKDPIKNDKDSNKNDNSKGNDDNGTPPPSAAVKMLTKDELAKLRNGQPLQQSSEHQPAQPFQPMAQMGNQGGGNDEVPAKSSSEQQTPDKPTSKRDGVRNLRMGRSFDKNEESPKPVKKTTLDKSKMPEHSRIM